MVHWQKKIVEFSVVVSHPSPHHTSILHLDPFHKQAAFALMHAWVVEVVAAKESGAPTNPG